MQFSMHYSPFISDIFRFRVFSVVFCGSVEMIEAARETLSQKATSVYIQRAQKLYAVATQRTSLFQWTLSSVEITALADPSYHGRNNVVRVMRDIDPARYVKRSVNS